jgi:hypothetical protein
MDAAAPLSADELAALRDIAGTMIPADAALRMPGADDPLIQGDIARSVGRDTHLVREALVSVAKRSDGRFASLDRDKREALFNEFYANGGPPAVALGRVVLGAYYRDDRVLIALGMEARAPFPKGHVVEQGDWSLLDPVRARPTLWRDDRVATGER